MTFTDELDVAGEGVNQTRRSRRPKPPPDWQPHIDTERGVAVIALETPPREDDAVRHAFLKLLETQGFDMALWGIRDDEIEVRTYEVPIGGEQVHRVWYYKARIVRTRSKADLSELLDDIRRHKPRKLPPPGGPYTYHLCLADWQLGKRDYETTNEVTARIRGIPDQVIRHVSQLKRVGFDIGEIVVAGMGDLLEGCTGFYPSQQFQVELDGREQARVARRLVVHLVKHVAPLAASLRVVAVPGNHGEKRQNGAAVTGPGDNTDLEVFDQVAEVLAENPERYGHVRFHIPRDETSVLIETGGQWVGYTHGHIPGFRGSVLPMGRVWEWWKGQAHGGQPVGDASVLVAGHFHHFAALEQGTRTYLQCPTLDAGSQWFTDRHGYASRPGTLSFLTGPEGLSHIQVHR